MRGSLGDQAESCANGNGRKRAQIIGNQIDGLGQSGSDLGAIVGSADVLGESITQPQTGIRHGRGHALGFLTHQADLADPAFGDHIHREPAVTGHALKFGAAFTQGILQRLEQTRRLGDYGIETVALQLAVLQGLADLIDHRRSGLGLGSANGQAERQGLGHVQCVFSSTAKFTQHRDRADKQLGVFRVSLEGQTTYIHQPGLRFYKVILRTGGQFQP